MTMQATPTKNKIAIESNGLNHCLNLFDLLEESDDKRFHLVKKRWTNHICK